MAEQTNVAAKSRAKTTKAAAAAKPSGTPAAEESTSPLASGELEREMDRLSLEQAVRDFEIANARVIDLTQRLISANGRVVELQQDLDRHQAALVDVTTRHQAVLNSQAYRLADKLRTVRNLLRG